MLFLGAGVIESNTEFNGFENAALFRWIGFFVVG